MGTLIIFQVDPAELGNIRVVKGAGRGRRPKEATGKDLEVLEALSVKIVCAAANRVSLYCLVGKPAFPYQFEIDSPETNIFGKPIGEGPVRAFLGLTT